MKQIVLISSFLMTAAAFGRELIPYNLHCIAAGQVGSNVVVNTVQKDGQDYVVKTLVRGNGSPLAAGEEFVVTGFGASSTESSRIEFNSGRMFQGSGSYGGYLDLNSWTKKAHFHTEYSHFNEATGLTERHEENLVVSCTTTRKR